MAQTKRSYYAIIPATVRYDEKLIPSAKLLYGEITALCNEKGYCWASNDYFANLYGVSKGTIQRWLKSLEEQNYIKRTVTRKEGSNEIDARYIHLCGDPHLENDTTPHLENDQDNNTSFNNTNNIVDSDESKKKSLIELESNFNKLWSLYPNKQGKKKAFAAYCKAIKSGDTNKAIQNGIVAYKKHLVANDWLKPAHGSTWFVNERWNDEYDTKVERPGKSYIDVADFRKEVYGSD